MFYKTLGCVCLNFFPQDLFFFFCFWVFKTWYFIGVTFCTASCIFVFVFVALNFLNTLCFTIIRLDVALLLARIKTASFCFLLSNLSGFPFSFHTNRNCQFSSNLCESVVLQFGLELWRSNMQRLNRTLSPGRCSAVEWRSALCFVLFSHENQRITAIPSKFLNTVS